MTGAILSWGCEGSTTDNLLRLVTRHRVSRVVDLRPKQVRTPGFGAERLETLLGVRGVGYERRADLGPSPDLAAVGRLYTEARSGHRLLVLGHEKLPADCRAQRGQLLSAIAGEAALYARSGMGRIIEAIEVLHFLGPARGTARFSAVNVMVEQLAATGTQ